METTKKPTYDFFTTSDGRLWMAKRPEDDQDWTPEQKRFAALLLAGMGVFIVVFACLLFLVVRWELQQ